ncbi:MAG: hypothetical protein HXX18_09575 [Bacteroidetes bacterium]|nr:hypothetical protein [Bacteroidota bacterium]
MKRIRVNILIIISILIFIGGKELKAQRSFGSRIFTGGNLGLQFGSVTLVDVSPMIGYRLTEDIDIGISLTYKYYNYKDYYAYTDPQTKQSQYFDLKTNILGGGVFGRYHFTENLFAHVEVEYLDFKIDTYTVYNNGLEKGKENIGITSLFIGGGYKQEIGSNSFFTLMILYNLNESNNSPYTNPIIRAGFGIGL